MPDHPKPFRPRPYAPAPWLPGPHAQTVAGRYLRRPVGVTYRRERLDTPDGDFLDLDHAAVAGVPLPESAPLAVLVHGLEGGSRSSYMLETCRALAGRGIRAVAMNFRSCSGEPNRARRIYHAGETGDLAQVLEHLAPRAPREELLAVGFSLGGNVLLKHLGEAGAASRVRAAVAVSVPYDLSAGADHLERTFMGRVYTGVFVRSLRRKYRSRLDVLGEATNASRVLEARSFREFDDAATARLHGFRDAEHYYAESSSRHYLPGVRVPTLLIHAVDDPFVDPAFIPHRTVRESPWLTAAVTERGGHVGFIAGPGPWRPSFWAEAEAARYLAVQAGTEPAEDAQESTPTD